MVGRSLIDTLRVDVRHAVRRIARAPGVSLAIVLSLTVGMASVVTLLGVVDSLLFRTAAGLREPTRVVGVGSWSMNDRLSYPDYIDLRDQTRTLESVSAFAIWNYSARVGALPADLAWLVLREAIVVAAVGLAIGIVGAVAAANAVRAMTFGVSATDPRVFVATAFVFVVVTGVGALVPSLRAALTDPRTVLAAD